MPRDLSSPDIQVRFDEQRKVVRQLSHPYPAASESAATPRGVTETPHQQILSLATAYVSDHADVFGISLEDATPHFRVTLRPVEVKEGVAPAVAVTFDQYVDEWPVWRAGVTVRIDARRMRVTGAHNAGHLAIRLHRPAADAPFVPGRIDADVMRTLLRLPPQTQLRAGQCRSLVYAFTQANRITPQTESVTPYGDESAPKPCFPGLPLPELRPEVLAREGMHCVVTEALFTVYMAGWGQLDCRAFVDPEGGDILYLRALVSCATTMVFARDPGSVAPPAPGTAFDGASPPAELDLLRTKVELPGLDPPDAQGRRGLSGELIRLVNLEPPELAMPVQEEPFHFDYRCDTPEFAACSAYYQCDRVFRLVESLGIDVRSYFRKTQFPITVDPHAFRQGVNAQAVGRPGGGLAQFRFGSLSEDSTFGIAADIRVVLHEFGHAVLWEHINAPSFPFAHSPGDSFAAILMAPFSEAKDPGRTFPFLTHLTSFERRHDREVGSGWRWFGGAWDHGYAGEQVLSSSLFRLYLAAGGDSPRRQDRIAASRYVVKLILTGIALLHVSPQHPDVLLDNMVEADAMNDEFEGIPGGALGKVIHWAFEEQGLRTPEVDIYIDDGRQGRYLPYRVEFFQDTPGVWNRLRPDAGETHEVPRAGVPNFAYVRVGNRGSAAAEAIELRVLQMPDGEQGRWGQDWTPVGEDPLRLRQRLEPGAGVVAGPIAWTPRASHDHLLVHASCATDRSSLLAVNPVGQAVDFFVRLDNNAAARRF